ncbi:integrase core domain protein [Trichonephila clavipes]|nr:integrase core domain protein [Trichonephila clavipes]
MLLAKDDKKSFEELTVQLCMFERNFTKVEHSSKKSQEALIATKSERPKQEGKYKSKSRKEDSCNYCKRKGHWINRNLFSVLAAQDRNPNSEFVSTPTECWLKVNDDVVLYVSRNVNGSLFKANFEPILPKEMIEVPYCYSRQLFATVV